MITIRTRLARRLYRLALKIDDEQATVTRTYGVTVQVDGPAVHRALLDMKRRNGDNPLGLA